LVLVARARSQLSDLARTSARRCAIEKSDCSRCNCIMFYFNQVRLSVSSLSAFFLHL
jgi:hypothetical protein